jgi:hypothetical protein
MAINYAIFCTFVSLVICVENSMRQRSIASPKTFNFF